MNNFEIPERDELKYPLEYYYPDSDINKKSPSIEDLITLHNNSDSLYRESFDDFKTAKYFRIVRDIANRILKNKESMSDLFVELSSTVYLDIDEHLYYFSFTEACILLTRKDVDMKRLDLPEYNRYVKLYNQPMDINLN